MMGWKSLIKDEVVTPFVSLRVHYATLVPLKGRQCFQIVITRDKTNQKELSPFKGDERNEAGRNGAEGVTKHSSL